MFIHEDSYCLLPAFSIPFRPLPHDIFFITHDLICTLFQKVIAVMLCVLELNLGPARQAIDIKTIGYGCS